MKKIFNVLIYDRNTYSIISYNLDIDELYYKFPEVIDTEGDFWRGSFWDNYHFLFCISDKLYYFIKDNEFNWDKVKKHYPDLWDNEFLKNLHKDYNREKNLNYLLGKN